MKDVTSEAADMMDARSHGPCANIPPSKSSRPFAQHADDESSRTPWHRYRILTLSLLRIQSFLRAAPILKAINPLAFSFLRLLRQSYARSISPSYTTGLSTSWLIPPWILFAVRVLISSYAFVVLFYRIGRWETSNDPSDEGDAGRSFSFFTVLSYWGLAFYFAFAAAHTGSLAARGRARLESWPGWLRWAHSAFYITVTVFPWVVTGVFWAILADRVFESKYRTWSDISQHALNSVFAFFEIIVPASEPHPWIQLIPLIVILACYLGLAYLTHATQGWYVYSFLDIQEYGSGLVAGACVGILVASIVVFVIVRYLIWLRQWVVEKKLGMKPKVGHRRAHDYTAHEMKDARATDSPLVAA